ncbi:MAG: head completion/stabilization protein [Thiotrichales bacterium]|jgi:hypothetical protein|nr:head completion/stabilization protein [Thiotrichales bacterium]
MAKFVGEKTEQYDDIVPGNGQYPTLSLADFQKSYSFLEDIPQASALVTMTLVSRDIQKQLSNYYEREPDLVSFSLAEFGSGDFWQIIYREAVFTKTASDLLAKRIATDASKNAADRQQALEDKRNYLDANYRELIGKLMNEVGITVALI